MSEIGSTCGFVDCDLCQNGYPWCAGIGCGEHHRAPVALLGERCPVDLYEERAERRYREDLAAGLLPWQQGKPWPATCVCRCGARREPIEDVALCEPEPSYIPGALIDPCTCPRCFTCSRPLDDDGRCGNIHCLNLGLHIPRPD